MKKNFKDRLKQKIGRPFKVGDKVKTSKEYKDILTTKKPFSGIIQGIEECDTNRIALVKTNNNRKTFISLYWLVKDRGMKIGGIK